MRTRTAAALFLPLVLLFACGGERARAPLEETWGLSARMALESQKLDPMPKTDQPVTGVDGVFAKGALDAYRKSSEPAIREADSKIKPMQSILGNKGGSQ